MVHFWLFLCCSYVFKVDTSLTHTSLISSAHPCRFLSLGHPYIMSSEEETELTKWGRLREVCTKLSVHTLWPYFTFVLYVPCFRVSSPRIPRGRWVLGRSEQAEHERAQLAHWHLANAALWRETRPLHLWLVPPLHSSPINHVDISDLLRHVALRLFCISVICILLEVAWPQTEGVTSASYFCVIQLFCYCRTRRAAPVVSVG